MHSEENVRDSIATAARYPFAAIAKATEGCNRGMHAIEDAQLDSGAFVKYCLYCGGVWPERHYTAMTSNSRTLR